MAARERVLITGGSGFIGANLAHDLVAEGHDVHLLLRPEARTWRLAGLAGRYTAHAADLCDPGALRRAVAACRPDVRGEATNEIRHQYLSAAKARQMLGWAPRYGLDEALAETVAWYREYLAAGGEGAPRAA